MESEYMKEARRLLDDVAYENILWGSQASGANKGRRAELGRRIDAAHAALLSHIAKGERNYELIPPSAAEWFASGSAIANQDWRGGWDACRNRARALLDASVAKGGQARNAGVMVVPTDPVREAEIELADMQQNGDADDVLAAQINLEGVRHAARAKTADESGVPAPSYCDPGSGKPCMRPTTAGQQAGGGEDGKHCQVQVIHLTNQQREMLSAKGVTHIPGRAAPADADAPIPAEVVRRALEAHKSSLLVLCTLERANDWHVNMQKDIGFAIDGNRAAITELQQALEKHHG